MCSPIAHLSGQYESEQFSGVLEVQPILKQSAKFELSVGTHNCTGDLSGELVFVDQINATFTTAGCSLHFTFGHNTVKVIEKSSCDSHGAFCYFAGMYHKK